MVDEEVERKKKLLEKKVIFLSKKEKRKIEERKRRVCYEIMNSGLLILALYQWYIKYLYFLNIYR
jgi:hypothetical protein